MIPCASRVRTSPSAALRLSRYRAPASRSHSRHPPLGNRSCDPRIGCLPGLHMSTLDSFRVHIGYGQKETQAQCLGVLTSYEPRHRGEALRLWRLQSRAGGVDRERRTDRRKGGEPTTEPTKRWTMREPSGSTGSCGSGAYPFIVSDLRNRFGRVCQREMAHALASIGFRLPLSVRPGYRHDTITRSQSCGSSGTGAGPPVP